MRKINSIQKWIPIEKILEKGIIKLKKNKYIKILKVNPINFNLKTQMEKESILNSYKIFLKTCNFDIQILIQSKKEDLTNHIEKIKINSQNENNKFMFYANQEGREKTGQKKLPLNYANQKLVLTMAKNILKVIEGNKKFVLHRTEMTDRVIGYLEQYVEKTRNAYMHKDNLYDWSDIRIIRTKTYAAYFMILGTFFIDVEKLLDIND